MSLATDRVDFSKPLPERGFVIATWGTSKSGKTRFALEALRLGPVYIIDFDYGTTDILPQVAALAIETGNALYHHRLLVGDLGTPAGTGGGAGSIAAGVQTSMMAAQSYKKAFAEFRATYEEYLKDAELNHGTVIIDTFTQVRQLIDAVMLQLARERQERTSRLSQKQADKNVDEIQLQRFDYAEANVVTGGLIRLGYEHNVNLILIHRATHVYNSAGQETDEWKMQGWAEIVNGAATSMNLRHYRIDTPTPDGKGTNIKFMTLVEEARVKPQLRGLSLENTNLAEIRALVGR